MNTDKTYVSQHNKHYIIRASVIITKMEKSNKTNSSMTSLANSLGGSSSVKSSSPICSGRYNSTTAEEGLSIYNNISSCDTKIKTACSFNMTTDISKELKKCKKVMDVFRTKAEVKACFPKDIQILRIYYFQGCAGSSIGNCSCWGEAQGMVKGVKDCNIGEIFVIIISVKVTIDVQPRLRMRQ